MRGNRREFLRLLACCSATAAAHPIYAQGKRTTATFGVFSLFSPQRLAITPRTAASLTIASKTIFVRAGQQIHLSLAGDKSIVVNLAHDRYRTTSITLEGENDLQSAFQLAVPPPALHGTIRRNFAGSLHINTNATALQPIITMEIERAVASIVAAESAPQATRTYLEAQAIAARSFLSADGAVHSGYNFCDTTHCQFLREAPAPTSLAAKATQATKGICLHAGHSILRALYSQSCSGRTATLQELGIQTNGYPYYSVPCDYCASHPEVWQRNANSTPAHNERARLHNNRIYGWSALPSSDFEQKGNELIGRGVGHGIGLCQRGALAMSKQGASTWQILQHYYPNTTLG